MSATMTRHASKRCKQRGISSKDIFLVIEYGDVYYAGKGHIAYWVSKKVIRKFKKFNNILEKCKNIVVIMAENNVITAMHCNHQQKHWKIAV